MRLVDGFFYEPSTGEVFNDEGSKQAFTFEKVTDGFNPFNFASRETAESVAKFIQGWTGIEARIVDIFPAPAPNVNRPWPERMVQFNGKNFNAGLIASQIIRGGFERAKNQFLDGAR